MDLRAGTQVRKVTEVGAKKRLTVLLALSIRGPGELETRLRECLVEQPEVSEGVFFGDGQQRKCLMRAAGLDRLRQLDLVLGGEERDPADLLQVHPYRVVERDRVHHFDVHQELV